MLSQQAKDAIRELTGRYPAGREKSAVMPALYLVQEELGWLPPAAMREVAELLGLAPVHVAAVATFYTMYYKEPVGRHVIDVCTCLSCQLCGGYDILGHISRRLGISPGETTSDGRVTLREAECIGSCTTAPALQVNYQFHENLTAEQVDQILDELLAEAAGESA